MSHILFSSPTNSAKLMGSERHYLDNRAKNRFVESLNLLWFSEGHPLFKYCPSHVCDQKSAETYFRTLMGQPVAGYDDYDLVINTAIATGSNIVRLGSRIAGTCEVHGYFCPEDFDDIIATIKAGLVAGFYRQNQGWEDVVALFESTHQEHIVLSYSVCGDFLCDFLTDEEFDDEKLSEDDYWNLALERLRKVQHPITPDSNVLYGHGLTGYTLMQRLRASTN